LDDVLDLLHIPAGSHRREVVTHPLHLVVVRATDEIDELRVTPAQDRAPVYQPTGIERAAEGQRARLGDDRLVQVEERGRAAGSRLGHGVEQRTGRAAPWGRAPGS